MPRPMSFGSFKTTVSGQLVDLVLKTGVQLPADDKEWTAMVYVLSSIT
jgi:hypothetical protein